MTHRHFRLAAYCLLIAYGGRATADTKYSLIGAAAVAAGFGGMTGVVEDARRGGGR